MLSLKCPKCGETTRVYTRADGSRRCQKCGYIDKSGQKFVKNENKEKEKKEKKDTQDSEVEGLELEV
ncbi:MAG: hypothetical protein ACOC44_18305 [Promethearchaeia archaeon]